MLSIYRKISNSKVDGINNLNEFIAAMDIKKDEIIDIKIYQVEVNEYDSDKTCVEMIYWVDREDDD